MGQHTDPPRDLRQLLRDGGRPLIAILIVAALIRIAYGSAFIASHPLANTLVSDSLLYHEWATDIADGDWAGPAEPYHHPPLYPHVVGVIYTLFSPSPTVVICLQWLLGIGAALLGYGFARRIAPRKAALTASALSLLYLPTVLFESRLLPASLATFLAAAALYHLATPKPDGWTRGVSGLLLGLLAAARPNQLIALALVAPAAALRGPDGGFTRTGFWRRLLPIATGISLAIAPFTLRNAIRGGEPVLLCDTGGVNLYLAHHEDSAASFRTNDLRFANVADQPRVTREIAQRAEGREMSYGEVSTHFTKRAIQFVLAHPLGELRLIGKRLLAVVDSHEYGIVYPPEAERALLLPGRFLLLPFGVWAALAVLGAILCLGRPPAPPGRAEAGLFLIAQIVTVLLFFQYSRFRVPAMPAVTGFVALAFSVLGQWRALSRRRTLLAIGAAAAVLIPSLLPNDDATREQDAAGHVVLAQALAASGDPIAAEAEIDHALRLAPRMARAHLARVEVLRSARRAGEALHELEALYASAPPHPLLLVAMIRLLVEEADVRDVDRATALSNEALEIAPGMTEVRRAAARAYMAGQKWLEAMDAIEPTLRFSDRTAECWFLAGAARVELGLSADAIPMLHEAANGMDRDPRVAWYLWRALRDTGASASPEGRRALLRLDQLDPNRAFRR